MALEGWKKANGDKQAKRETMRKITHLMSLENEIKNHKRAIIRLQGERIEFCGAWAMAKVEIIPRMFRRRLEPVATADPHYAAMIQIQGVLAPMTEEEQTFVLETVCRNLDINRRHLKAYEFEE